MITMSLLIHSIRPLKHFNLKTVLHIGLPNDPLKDRDEKHSIFSMYRIYSNKRRPRISAPHGVEKLIRAPP